MKGSFHKSVAGKGLVSRDSLQAEGKDKKHIRFPLRHMSAANPLSLHEWKDNLQSSFAL